MYTYVYEQDFVLLIQELCRDSNFFAWHEFAMNDATHSNVTQLKLKDQIEFHSEI